MQNLENLRDARTALQRLITMNNVGNVQEVPDARAFVVTDFAPQVAAVYRQVRAMDAARARVRPRVEFVALKSALAERLVPVLQEMSGLSAKTPAAGRPPEGAAPSAPPLRIVADPWTNQVIVSGPSEQVEKVLLVIPRLDRPAAPRPEVPPALEKPPAAPDSTKPAPR